MKEEKAIIRTSHQNLEEVGPTDTELLLMFFGLILLIAGAFMGTVLGTRTIDRYGYTSNYPQSESVTWHHYIDTEHISPYTELSYVFLFTGLLFYIMTLLIAVKGRPIELKGKQLERYTKVWKLLAKHRKEGKSIVAVCEKCGNPVYRDKIYWDRTDGGMVTYDHETKCKKCGNRLTSILYPSSHCQA